MWRQVPAPDPSCCTPLPRDHALRGHPLSVEARRAGVLDVDGADAMRRRIHAYGA